MKYRQINLDFHTSECVKNIGEKFSKEQFQEALKVGHIDSITLFSKCHHGWSYHPTKANQMHPNLDFDLFGSQVEAAKEIGVRTQAYLSAGLDEKELKIHPEWASIAQWEHDEGIDDPLNTDRVGYHGICLNTPYLDKLLTQIREVLTNYDVDGVFLDIVGVHPCYCKNCVNQLISEGKNPENLNDALDLAERVYKNYTDRVRQTIDEVRPGLAVFHNGGHIRHGRRDLAYVDSHLELESLPTGGWGYDHFPISASYARTLGMEYLGMTGKFHTTWGEFGGFKHPNALRYEVALAAANCAGSSVGDQLHPSGLMDMATYQLIGNAYKELEKAEPWLKGYKNIADIAVLSNEAIGNYYNREKKLNQTFATNVKKSDAGCSRILLEGKYLFNYIDTEEDFNKYKVLILPDNVIVDDFIKEKICGFIENGGKLLATGMSAIMNDKQEFAFDFGCEYNGEALYNPDYFRPKFELKSLLNSAFVMYSKGTRITVTDGEVLGWRENPYFNRTKEHFCSHRHTPNNFYDTEPGYVEGRDGIYIGWNVFEDYAEHGNIVFKEMVIYALDRLLADGKSILTNLPAQGVVTLTQKGSTKIVHLLYASPVKRGTNVDIIEDLIPIYDTAVSVISNIPKRVYMPLCDEEIPFEYKDGRVDFNVNKFICNAMIAIEE